MNTANTGSDCAVTRLSRRKMARLHVTYRSHGIMEFKGNGKTETQDHR